MDCICAMCLLLPKLVGDVDVPIIYNEYIGHYVYIYFYLYIYIYVYLFISLHEHGPVPASLIGIIQVSIQ